MRMPRPGAGAFHSFTSVTHRRYGDLRMGRWRPHGDADWGRVPWLVRTEVDGQTVLDVADSNTVGHLQPGSGYHQTDVVQKFRFGGMERHVILNLQHSTSSRFRGSTASTIWRPMAVRNGPNGHTVPNAVPWRLCMSTRGSAGWKVTLTPYWQQVEETRLKARFGAQDREVQEERVDVVGVQVDLDHRLGPWDLTYGAHWDHHRVRSAAWNERRADGQRLDTPALTRYPNGGAEMGSVSAYGGLSRRWNSWKLHTAARYTRGWLDARFEPQEGLPIPVTGVGFSPFSNVGYHRGALTGSTTLRWTGHHQWGGHAVLSSAFRNPNVDDVEQVRAKDGFVIIPADSLLPERLYSAEVGGYWRTRDHKFTLQGSGFSTLLLDAIQAVDTAFIASDGSAIGTLVAEGDTNQVQVNANVGRGLIRGMQWQAHYRAADGWRWRATLNLTRGTER